MDWWGWVLLGLVAGFFLWRHSKAKEKAVVANEVLTKDNQLFQHIKAGMREHEWQNRGQAYKHHEDGDLLFENAHMAAYNVAISPRPAWGSISKTSTSTGCTVSSQGTATRPLRATTEPTAPSRKRVGYSTTMIEHPGSGLSLISRRWRTDRLYCNLGMRILPPCTWGVSMEARQAERRVKELHEYVRLNFQLYMAWFTFFGTVNFASLGWLASTSETARLTSIAWLVPVMFISQNVLGILASKYVSDFFYQYDGNVRALERILVPDENTSQSSLSLRLYNQVVALIAGALAIIAAVWCGVLIVMLTK